MKKGKLQAGGVLREEYVLVTVTYAIDPRVEACAQELGLQIYRLSELLRARRAKERKELLDSIRIGLGP